MRLGPTPGFARVSRFFGPLNLAAVGDGLVGISADGRRWHKAKLPFPTGMTITDLDFAGGMLWVFGKRASPAATGACVTEDGENWVYIPIAANGLSLYAVAKLASGFNVVAGERAGAEILSSANLTGFTSRAFEGAVDYFTSATARSDLAVLLAANRTVQTTSNGTTFTARASSLAAGSGEFIRHVSGLNRFIAGTSAGSVSTSEDGLSYTARTAGIGSARRFGGTGGKYLLGGFNGDLRRSVDLLTWGAITSKPVGFTETIAGIGVADGELIVAGANGGFLVSADGLAFNAIDTNWPFGDIYRMVSRV